MANWINTIDISAEWKLAEEGEITVSALASSLADKLDALLPRVSDGRFHIIRMLREFVASGSDDADEFDNIMAVVYDWGDTNLSPGKWPPDKLCWIGTF